MLGKHKSYRGRSYINHAYNQKVDDDCLEYKSVPMAIAKEMLRPEIKVKNDYNGVHHIYNQLPARPVNINAMAVSLARASGQPISKVYDSIISKIANEERALVNNYVETTQPTSIEFPRSRSSSNVSRTPSSLLAEFDRLIASNAQQISQTEQQMAENQQQLVETQQRLRSLILGNDPVVADPETNRWVMEQARMIEEDRISQASARSFMSEAMPEGEGIERPVGIPIFTPGEVQRSSIGRLPRELQARIRTTTAINIAKPRASYIRRAYNAGKYLTGEREEPPKTPLSVKDIPDTGVVETQGDLHQLVQAVTGRRPTPIVKDIEDI